jgi:hypothetical protein
MAPCAVCRSFAQLGDSLSRFPTFCQERTHLLSHQRPDVVCQENLILLRSRFWVEPRAVIKHRGEIVHSQARPTPHACNRARQICSARDSEGSPIVQKWPHLPKLSQH